MKDRTETTWEKWCREYGNGDTPDSAMDLVLFLNNHLMEKCNELDAVLAESDALKARVAELESERG